MRAIAHGIMLTFRAVDIGDLAAVAGPGLLVWGISMISTPAAIILSGLVLAGLAILRWFKDSAHGRRE